MASKKSNIKVVVTFAELESALRIGLLETPQPCQRLVRNTICGAQTNYAIVAIYTRALKEKEVVTIPLCEKHIPRWLRKYVRKATEGDK
ncbi:MAG: hypothetical protein QXT00_07935 [Ignisphaera sp.]